MRHFERSLLRHICADKHTTKMQTMSTEIFHQKIHSNVRFNLVSSIMFGVFKRIALNWKGFSRCRINNERTKEFMIAQDRFMLHTKFNSKLWMTKKSKSKIWLCQRHQATSIWATLRLYVKFNRLDFLFNTWAEMHLPLIFKSISYFMGKITVDLFLYGNRVTA